MTEVEAAVAREILRLAREELRLEGGVPGPDEPLAARLDSLALLALAVAVEDRFHVILTDDDAGATRTLAELARLVAARAPAERLPGVDPAAATAASTPTPNPTSTPTSTSTGTPTATPTSPSTSASTGEPA